MSVHREVQLLLLLVYSMAFWKVPDPGFDARRGYVTRLMSVPCLVPTTHSHFHPSILFQMNYSTTRRAPMFYCYEVPLLRLSGTEPQSEYYSP